jgi:hypothetical protein
VTYSESWPKTGMTRSGRAYELPTSAHHTTENEYSSLLGTQRADMGSMTSKPNARLETDIGQLLPTPVADHSRGLPQPGTDYASLPNVVIGLLPTPTSRDWKDGACADADVPTNALLGRVAVRALLPTPTAMNPNDGEDLAQWEARRQRVALTANNGNGFGTPLAIAVRLIGANTDPLSDVGNDDSAA